MEVDPPGESAPLKLVKTPSSNHSADCSPLNLIKTPGSAAPPAATGAGASAYHSAPSSSYSLGAPTGNGQSRDAARVRA